MTDVVYYFSIFVENKSVMKKLLFLLILLCVFVNANATHIMGGEITWECIKDPADPNVGKYIFKMKL